MISLRLRPRFGFPSGLVAADDTATDDPGRLEVFMIFWEWVSKEQQSAPYKFRPRLKPARACCPLIILLATRRYVLGCRAMNVVCRARLGRPNVGAFADIGRS